MTDCSLMITMDTKGQFSMMWTGNRLNLSYPMANDMCKCLFGEEQTLASIHSKEENDIVQEMMIERMILLEPISSLYGRDDLCIGLNKLDNPLKWQWSDGSSLDYTNWEQIFKIEPDPEDFYTMIDRQSGAFTWWGRGRVDGDIVENIRWILCDNGNEPIKPEDKDEGLNATLEIIIPSISGGIVLFFGFCIWILKRFFNIIIFKCCDLRLERTSEANSNNNSNSVSNDIELIDEIVGDAEIIIDD